jgi:formylglycine-generating enzyme required for sulfatase activity
MNRHAIGTIVILAAVISSRSKPCEPSEPLDKTQQAASDGNTKGAPREIAVSLGGGVTLELVLVPAGEFVMGSPDSDRDADSDEKPRHRVRITNPFYLGRNEVTQEQWEALMGSNPSKFKGRKNPVEQVSWDDCQEFIERLNKKIPGARFQLPTEAQWEYACRAGSKTKYCDGDDERQLGEYAWYTANSGLKTHPVGAKKPNAWGLCEMHGNVAEWCADWWDESYYGKSPTNDPAGPPSRLSARVVRGGGWGDDAMHCRSAIRDAYGPVYRRNSVGLRVSHPVMDVLISYSKVIAVDLGGSVTLELVPIPVGEFLMGSPRDKEHDKQHLVRITKPFYLGKYEVTQEQWVAVMGSNPSKFKGPKNPVEQVSWSECEKFLRRLNEKLPGAKFQLPTEAQWEYACRAGTTTKFCCGDDIRQLDKYAWYSANSGWQTNPVGEKKPNAWGLYDMHGNVFEWCADWWDWDYYGNSPTNDPTGPTNGVLRVYRGGGWGRDWFSCKSEDRSHEVSGYRSSHVGLRISRVLAE